MIEIQTATLEDFPIIQNIAHQTWPHTFSAILSADQIEYMLTMMYSLPALQQQVLEKKHVFLLAKEGELHLGYCSYELNYQFTSKVKIHKIYVLPASQGKGVGKKLLNVVADIAMRTDNNGLSLNVNRDNTAVDFYQRQGFSITGQEDIDIGNGFLMEDYIMEMNLNVRRSE